MTSQEKEAHDLILHNIHAFIEHEGLRKERLAERMGKSVSAFYANLKGQNPKSIYGFAVELATVLGYKPHFFMDEHFSLPSDEETSVGLSGDVLFSVGKDLSPKGKEGLEQLAKICDLIRIYS